MPPLLALALLLALSLPSEASIDAAGDGAAPVFAAQMPGELPPLPPRFLPASADDPLDLWQRRVAEARQAMPAYAPRNGGRGIVMTTGRRTYFTAAAVTVRIIREHLGSTLPIELFFGGAEELPPAAVVYFENTWPDVRVVDAAALVAQLDASGHEPLDVKGYQIKALSIYLSAFDEVLWLDADDMPLSDPAGLFESELYKKHGAVFWPDICNMISVRSETYAFFGQKLPKGFTEPRPGRRTIWPATCAPTLNPELETGQILIDKRRAWPGLYLTTFLNVNHEFFLQRLFHGDKMTFHFGFLAAEQKYSLVPYLPSSVGIAGKSAMLNQDRVFCGNTLAQKHPDKNEILFLHRNLAKFKDTLSYFNGDTKPKKMWKYVAFQGPKDSWQLTFREELEDKFFAGSSANTQFECLMPEKPKIKNLPAGLAEMEDAALRYLKELRDLPFYPGYGTCSAESMFFCRNA